MPQQSRLLPLEQCTFSELGLQSVIRHLRAIPAFANLPEYKIRGAAFGLLTAGASSDNDHDVPFQSFHRVYKSLNNGGRDSEWRQNLRDIFMQAVFDHLTILDRASGGATILVHCPATRRPQTTAIPQEVKMEAFLPRALIAERREVGLAVSRIVQYIAEEIGVPAMQRWDLASNAKAWSSNNTPQRQRELPYLAGNLPVIPHSPSPRYILYGRIPGEIDQLIADAAPDLHVNAPAPLVAPPASIPPSGPHIAAPVPSAMASASNMRDDGEECEEVQMLSPKGKEHIRISYSSADPYTSDDLLALVESHYDSDGDLVPDAPRTSRGKQRADYHAEANEDLADVLAALQARIEELEDIKTAQELEIMGLRSALKGSAAASAPAGPAARAVPRPSCAPTDAFVHGSSRVTPHNSARPASRADSLSSFSAISSVSSITPSSGPSTPRRRTHPVAQHASPAPPPTAATMSPRLAPLESRRPAGFTFGRHADTAVNRLHLPSATHNILQDVADQYPEEEWPVRLRQRIFACPADVAQYLVKAMKKDRAV